MIDSMMDNIIIPFVGIKQAHTWDVGMPTIQGMKTREVLSANLKRLMAVTPARKTLPLITKATGGELTNGTLDRIRRAERDTTLRNVEMIAQAFSLPAWQLLVPDLPVVLDEMGRVLVSAPGWPFAQEYLGRLLALPERERGIVEGRLIAAIEECERPNNLAVTVDEGIALVNQARLPPRASKRLGRKSA